ncbi:YigZ family protein [Xanthomonas arboricola]|uniref:IMPACT family protein n=1 Tax=Xanthomonas sp. WHRI 6106 TaxID=3161566 RepID=UPI00161D9419
MAAMLDTLAADAHHSLDIKHSRFLAHACALDTAAQALEIMQRVSTPDATHNCWAYRFGQDYRSSDDGEPSGTAGRPILAAIDGQGFDRVVVVVTRWYGGIKLGAGGLVRAYGGTAAECLRLATRRPLIAVTLLDLHCQFDDLGLVHAALAAFHADKLDEQFDATGAALRVQLPADQLAGLKTRLCDATRNRVHLSLPETA